jgi:hypothetical protein
MIDVTGIIHSIAGGPSIGYSGDDSLAVHSKVSDPSGVVVDNAGNVFIADHNRVRKIDGTTHIISTIAGNGVSASTGDGGLASAASVMPRGICLDKYHNIYIIDSNGSKVRKIDTGGIITTVGGTGVSGYSGDGGSALTANLDMGYGICCDSAGNIYLGCVTRVRKINRVTGIITTVAGNGMPTYIGDGIPATSAQFNVENIGYDTSRNRLYITGEDYRVYQVDEFGIFHVIAGTGVGGYNGDGIPATSAKVFNPSGVTVDQCGNVYIADASNCRIRKVTFSPTGATPTIAISASPNDTTCAGTPVTYTTSVAGAGAATYQWYVNGALTGATSASYTYTPANGDSIRATLAGYEVCNGAPVWANSNSINMVVQPILTPSVTISSISTTANIGSTVTVNAVVSGAGSSYNIKWYNNSVQFATTTAPSVTYTKTALIDTITARIVSSAPGCYDSAHSNKLVVRPGDGVEEINQVAPIEVYPNPATNIIYIQGEAEGYRIFNPVGVTLQSGQLRGTADTVPLNQLPPGPYLLDITDHDKLHTITRLIKR